MSVGRDREVNGGRGPTVSRSAHRLGTAGSVSAGDRKLGFRSAAGSGPECSSLALDSPASSSLSPDPGQAGLVFSVPGGRPEPPAPAGKGKRGRRRAGAEAGASVLSWLFCLLPPSDRVLASRRFRAQDASLSCLLHSELSWRVGVVALRGRAGVPSDRIRPLSCSWPASATPSCPLWAPASRRA